MKGTEQDHDPEQQLATLLRDKASLVPQDVKDAIEAGTEAEEASRPRIKSGESLIMASGGTGDVDQI